MLGRGFSYRAVGNAGGQAKGKTVQLHQPALLQRRRLFSGTAVRKKGASVVGDHLHAESVARLPSAPV